MKRPGQKLQKARAEQLLQRFLAWKSLTFKSFDLWNRHSKFVNAYAAKPENCAITCHSPPAPSQKSSSRPTTTDAWSGKTYARGFPTSGARHDLTNRKTWCDACHTEMRGHRLPRRSRRPLLLGAVSVSEAPTGSAWDFRLTMRTCIAALRLPGRKAWKLHRHVATPILAGLATSSGAD